MLTPDNPFGCIAPGEFTRRAFLKTGGMFLALQMAEIRGSGQSFPVSLPGPSICLAVSHEMYPPLLEKFIAKLDPAADDFVIEQYATGIQRVLDSWSSSICKSVRDVDAIRPSLSNVLRAGFSRPFQVVSLRSGGPLEVERRTFTRHEDSSREKFVEEWSAYLATFVSIETFELQIFGIRSSNLKPFEVDTDIRFNLVGTLKDGSREQRVGTWHIFWSEKMSAGDNLPQWEVLSWLGDSELRSKLKGPGFTDISNHL